MKKFAHSVSKGLLDGRGPELVSLQTRGERLEQGLASSDAAAAKAVLELADLPLSEYLLSCPDVTQADLQKLQDVLGLPDGCSFQNAAAALYSLAEMESNAVKQARLLPLMCLLVLPFGNADAEERNLVLASFRKGQFST